MVDQLSKQLQWFVNYSKSLTFQHCKKLKINFKIQFFGGIKIKMRHFCWFSNSMLANKGGLNERYPFYGHTLMGVGAKLFSSLQKRL